MNFYQVFGEVTTFDIFCENFLKNWKRNMR